MGGKKFFHTHRLTMCGLEKLASGAFTENCWQNGAETVAAAEMAAETVQKQEVPGYLGWLKYEHNVQQLSSVLMMLKKWRK